MENYSYSSYPDSHDSSPRSREIDCENASWDEPPSNYKVKFMCSYNGKIHPRPHDNQLAYVGGETKILAVDRNIRFSSIISKLSNICDSDVCFKYQLPGEDLDALISVTNDEDLEHMMLEYDRLHRLAAKPARLRLFLFPIVNNTNPSSAATSFDEEQQKSNQQWFVDALNSVPSIQANLDSTASSPPATASNTDFLFGFEKGAPPPPLQHQPLPVAPQVSTSPLPVIVDASQVNVPIIGSDSGRDDQISPSAMTPVEIQRQIHELQRMQIVNQEHQVIYQRKNEENLARAFATTGDYYLHQQPQQQQQKVILPEQQQQQQSVAQISMPIPSPANLAVPTGYWQAQQQDTRQMVTGGYPAQSTGADPQVYLIPSPAGMYHNPHHHQANVVRQVPAQGGGPGGYYGMQNVYREQQMYNMGPPGAVAPQQAQAQQPPPPQQVPTTAYTQMAYDNVGRQVFYTTATGGGGGMAAAAPVTVVPSSYQTVTAVGIDGRPSGALNQESKIAKPSQQTPV